MNQNIFCLDNVKFSYQQHLLFRDLSFKVQAGESICLLGANGSGKSTLLRILCGLIFPQEGNFSAFGHKITENLLENNDFARSYHRRVGFIFQNSDVQLFTTRVWDEIAFGPLQLGLGQEETARRVTDVLQMLKIEHLADRSPHRLSGGEKKKVALASVLALNPEVLILDEPTSGLDPRTSRWLTELLLELNHNGRTIIVSTHNLDLAHFISERALVLAEDHSLVYDGPTRNVLENRRILMEVNLIDEYIHVHGEEKHIHPYVHG